MRITLRLTTFTLSIFGSRRKHNFAALNEDKASNNFRIASSQLEQTSKRHVF